MKSLVTAVLFCALSGQALASDAPIGTSRFNVECPAPTLLPQLDAAYHQCGHELAGESCDTFVSLFGQLLPEYDCQRSFDDTAENDYTVPAVWLAGAAHEDFVRLLSTLRQRDARCLFGSTRFRATLDGHIAEEYTHMSSKVERALGASCRGL